MTLRNIVLTFLQKFRRKDAPILSYEARALFQWKILVGVFCFGFISVFAVNLFMYQDINQGEFVPVQQKSSTEIQAIKGDKLGETVRYFEIRKATFDQMKKNGTLPVDPSR